MTSWLRGGARAQSRRDREGVMRAGVSARAISDLSHGRVSEERCPGGATKRLAVRFLFFGMRWRDSSPAGLPAWKLFGSRILPSS